MTAATQTLTDFLLAQIAGDEAVARDAAILGAEIIGYDTHSPGDDWGQAGPYYPARVLAECEAKRRIVELHCGYSGGGSLMLCNECGGDTGSSLWPCETLATLASIYADREGFREEWRL